MALVGSGVEQIEVAFAHNVLGYRYGDRAFLPVDTPELQECIELGFVRLVVDGEEVIPPESDSLGGVTGRCCGQR